MLLWFRVICNLFRRRKGGKWVYFNVNSVEILKLSSQKTVLVLMHICSIHISVLRKPSDDGQMQKLTAFNLCLSTGGQ